MSTNKPDKVNELRIYPTGNVDEVSNVIYFNDVDLAKAITHIKETMMMDNGVVLLEDSFGKGHKIIMGSERLRKCYIQVHLVRVITD